jgi:hypothetical protein
LCLRGNSQSNAELLLHTEVCLVNEYSLRAWTMLMRNCTKDCIKDCIKKEESTCNGILPLKSVRPGNATPSGVMTGGLGLCFN